MDEYEVARNPWVDNDLDNLRAYIIKEFADPFAAKNTLSRIIKAMDKLRFAPERGTVRGIDKNHNSIRSISVGSQAVIFSIDNDNKRVEIIAVVFGKRNISKLLDGFLSR